MDKYRTTTCKNCEGKGYRMIDNPVDGGKVQVTCDLCWGAGYIPVRADGKKFEFKWDEKTTSYKLTEKTKNK